MNVRLVTAVLCVIASAIVAAGPQSVRPTAPESFRAVGQITGTGGGIGAQIVIQIDRYTTDGDHQALAKALKDGGHQAFLEALRKAPVVGTMKVEKRSIPLRWARQQDLADGRRIAVVAEQPVLFVGGGAVNAKPTEGFDVAVAEFTVDSVGLGKGSMSPAARVKAGGPTGVEIDDYAGKRFSLTSVARNNVPSP